MGAADQIRQHRARCARDVARLRILAREVAYADVPLTPPVAAETTEATATIVGEAQAACRTALVAVRGDAHDPGNPSLLKTRLARLEAAAADAAAAAAEGDLASLRQQLARFDALATAIWTVLYSTVAHGSGAGEEDARSGRAHSSVRKS